MQFSGAIRIVRSNFDTRTIQTLSNTMTTLPLLGENWHQGYEEDVSVILNCYCPNCGGSAATTNLLPTKIPLFREIIVTSLNCEDCNFRNTEVSFGGAIQEKGEILTLHVASADDLNRQIIKSDSASFLIPSLEFEIPNQTQRGTISTLEGVLKRAAANLEEQQPDRLKLGDVDNFHRCRVVIRRLRLMAGDSVDYSDDEENKSESPLYPFQVILDDPAGNSFIENPHAPSPDPQVQSVKYDRTPNQDMGLGLQPSVQAVQDGTIDDSNPQHKNIVNATHLEPIIQSDIGRQEALKFATTCPHCHRSAETDMCVTDIPHFKEVIIMSMTCEMCGYRSNEVKGSGAIPKYGTKIELRVETSDDLEREVLKSDTAGIAIPELDFELEEGGLDGLYTTVEGLLNKMRNRLEQANPFGMGDAARKQHTTNDGGEFSGFSPNHARYMAFLDKLKQIANGNLFGFTVVITDPLSNSFVGPVPKDAVGLSFQAEKDGNNQCYQDYVDPRMQITEYERTHDQNEMLGLNDIKTENYNETMAYYGTDTQHELPDRLRRLDVRGPDHPHDVGKAPVESDTTVMGAKSLNFAVPGMGQRGTRYEPSHDDAKHVAGKVLRDSEYNDEAFMMNDEYDGPRDGLVYKDGAQGLGYVWPEMDVMLSSVSVFRPWLTHRCDRYYANKPLLDCWTEQEGQDGYLGDDE